MGWPWAVCLAVLVVATAEGQSQMLLAGPTAARLSLMRARPVLPNASLSPFVDGLSIGSGGSVYSCFADNNVWTVTPNDTSHSFSSSAPTHYSAALAYVGPSSAQYIASIILSVPFYAVSSKPAQSRPVLALADYSNGRVDFLDMFGALATSTTPSLAYLFSVNVPGNFSSSPDELTKLDKYGGLYALGGGVGHTADDIDAANNSTIFYISPFSLELRPQDMVNVSSPLPTAKVVKAMGRVGGIALDRDGSSLYVAENSGTSRRIWRFSLLGPGVLDTGTVVIDLSSQFYGSFVAADGDFSCIRSNLATNLIVFSFFSSPHILLFHPPDNTTSITPTPSTLSATPSPTLTHRASNTSLAPSPSPSPTSPSRRSLPLIGLVRLIPEHLLFATSFAMSSSGRDLIAAGPCVVPSRSPGRACFATVPLGPLATVPDLGLVNVSAART